MTTRAKLILILVFLMAAFFSLYYFVLSPKSVENQPVASVADKFFGWRFPVVKFPITGTNDIAYSDIRDPGGIPDGLPVRLKIPIIGVDSAIEDALITSDGRMDVPSGSVDVAWFALGPHPGQEGSAVIGGHFGIRNGVKFVFYDLDKLKVGDKVYIEDDRGETLAFQVRSIQLFDRNADATNVFTSHDGLAHLNLITCEGIWNRVNDSYPQRRVVFTDAIPKEGQAPIGKAPSVKGITKAEDIATFPRVFGIGASGADVSALQKFLEQKKFLSIPSGVAYGYFGNLTSSAVSKYQRSAGLPGVGYFGPLTRAKVLSELGGDTGLPNAGDEQVSSSSGDPKVSPVSNQTLIPIIKSLFETPKDSLITLLLLISIILIGFKIFRR